MNNNVRKKEVGEVAKRKLTANHVVRDQLKSYLFDGKEYRLMEREYLFAMNYCQNGFNRSAAAVAAGYSAKTKGEIGYELLLRPRIQEYIKAVQDNLGHLLGISALDIAREYAKIGFSDVRKIYDKNGELLDVTALDDVTAASVASVEVTEVFDRGKYVGKNKKIKFYDKVVALDKLARMIGVDVKNQAAETKKPEPLQIEIKHSPTKIKKSGDDGTIPGNTEV